MKKEIEGLDDLATALLDPLKKRHTNLRSSVTTWQARDRGRTVKDCLDQVETDLALTSAGSSDVVIHAAAVALLGGLLRKRGKDSHTPKDSEEE